ncbi:MAG: hypothetical protein ABL997_11080 [Planctomycetota bacterium]
MRHTLSLVPLSMIAACAAAPSTPRTASTELAPTFVSSLPSAAPVEPAATQPTSFGADGNAPADALVPIGIGFTTSPVMAFFASSYDIPIDTNLTLGPSVHFGVDDHESLFGAMGQARYFLPRGETLQPYVSVGGGLGYVDTLGRSSEWGLLFSAGGGLRIQTSDRGMIASELNYYISTEELSGERGYWGWQVLQFVMKF